MASDKPAQEQDGLGLSGALADALAAAEELAEKQQREELAESIRDNVEAAQESATATDGALGPQIRGLPSDLAPRKEPQDRSVALLRRQLQDLHRDMALKTQQAERTDKQLNQARADLKTTRQRYLRLADEHEALTAKVERLEESIPTQARQALVKSWIPALDSTFRAISHLQRLDSLPEAHSRALALLMTDWQRCFEDTGVQLIRDEGRRFDPELHEAISKRHEPGVSPGQVLEQVGPGYVVEGKLLRTAQVVVSCEDDAT